MVLNEIHKVGIQFSGAVDEFECLLFKTLAALLCLRAGHAF